VVAVASRNARPWLIHEEEWVQARTLLVAWTSAPLSVRRSAATGCLWMAAKSSGVHPCAQMGMGDGWVGAGLGARAIGRQSASVCMPDVTVVSAG
jgi:hypothetical protein